MQLIPALVSLALLQFTHFPIPPAKPLLLGNAYHVWEREARAERTSIGAVE
jgi:hypothetical protein